MQFPEYLSDAINELYRAAYRVASDSSSHARMNVRDARTELESAILRYCGDSQELVSSESAPT